MNSFLLFILFISLSTLSFAVRKWLSGVGNAIFYAKGTKYAFHKKLAGFIANIHSLETPQFYSHAGSTFFLGLLLFRYEIEIESNFYNWLVCIGLAALLVLAGSALAGPFYQGYINISWGKPWIDPNEKRKANLISSTCFPSGGLDPW